MTELISGKYKITKVSLKAKEFLEEGYMTDEDFEDYYRIEKAKLVVSSWGIGEDFNENKYVPYTDYSRGETRYLIVDKWGEIEYLIGAEELPNDD